MQPEQKTHVPLESTSDRGGPAVQMLETVSCLGCKHLQKVAMYPADPVYGCTEAYVVGTTQPALAYRIHGSPERWVEFVVLTSSHTSGVPVPASNCPYTKDDEEVACSEPESPAPGSGLGPS